MTEYDYSPEACERYLASQQRISKWVATTEEYRNEYGNALTVPPSQTGSHSQQRGQLLSTQSLPSHSRYLQNPPHSQPCFTSSCQRSAVDPQSQCLQRSSHDTLSRASVSFVSSQSQHSQAVSPPHGSFTNVHTAPSQHRNTHTTKTSSTCVAVSYPQKPVELSQNASIQSDAYGQQSRDANVSSQRSITSVSSLQKAALRHHASTPHLETATRQPSPAYMLTIPPSEKPTHVYAPAGWVPSAGLVIVPSNGQNTFVMILPSASHGHISVPYIQHKDHTQPPIPRGASPCSSSAKPQTSAHASSSQTIYVPVPVVIIERERRSKNVGVKKSKKKDKRNRSKARE